MCVLTVSSTKRYGVYTMYWMLDSFFFFVERFIHHLSFLFFFEMYSTPAQNCYNTMACKVTTYRTVHSDFMCVYVCL